MINRLITTNITSLLSKRENNILLGDWCLFPTNKINLKSYSFKKLDYHFNQVDKLKNDFQYLKLLYPKLLAALVKFLNNYHGTKYSSRYWEIVIGPTVVYLLSVLWDRWETIKFALGKQHIHHVPILEYGPRDFISQDFYDIFSNKADSHFWNNCVFSEIIKSSFKINISKIKNEIFKNQSYFINQDLKSSYKSKILDQFLSLFTRQKDILFYKANLGKLDSLRYMISQKKLIQHNTEFSKKIKLCNKNIDRDSKLDFNIENDFEKLLSEKIVQFFPLSHLEGFKKIQTEALKINLRPKYIVTAFGHVCNDLFKIWTAENIEKAYSRLIISSHGGYVENCINFNSWINISDKFISWENTQNKKIVQLPPLNLTNNKNNKNNKNILFCTSNTNLYAYRIHDYVVSSQMIKVMNFWKKFFLTINKKAKHNIVIRHVPNFDPWNQKSYLAKLFRHNVLSKKKKFIDELRCAKIVINTAMQTTFFESMNYGTPTLVLLKYDLWNLSHKGKCIYDKLKKNKILFNNISDLNQHLDKILDAPDIWWNSQEIKKIREEFHSHYCRKGDFTDWNNFFNNLPIK